MTPFKAAMTIAALAISAPVLAMSKPDPQQAHGLPSGGGHSSSGGHGASSSSGGGVVDVSSPSALLLLGLAAGGLILGRRGRK